MSTLYVRFGQTHYTVHFNRTPDSIVIESWMRNGRSFSTADVAAQLGETAERLCQSVEIAAAIEGVR